MGKCIVGISARMLDGQLGMVIVYVCECARLGGILIGGGRWGGLVIFPLQKGQKAGWAEKPLYTPCLVRRSKTK